MTQPFTDALTWVPKSRALAATLARAFDLARAQGHAEVGLEHLLAGLIEDPDASAVLLACTVDLLKLNQSVSDHLAAMPGAGVDMPVASAALKTILDYAVAAARQSKRNEVNGAIVLAAIVGEAKSDAARMLLGLGLTFEGTVMALRRAAAAKPAPPAAPPPPPLPVAEAPVAVAIAPAPMAQPVPATADAPPLAGAPSAAAPIPPPVAPQIYQPAQPVTDDDPITTARRRVEAMRSGQGLAPAVAPSSATAISAPPAMPEQASSRGASAGDWAPPPIATQPQSPAPRASRMPPPVPPLAPPPGYQNGGGASPSPRAAEVPWSDGPASDAEIAVAVLPDAPTVATPAGEPIDVARLFDVVRARMRIRSTSTIEIKIPRSAVLGTAMAIGAGGDAAVTRALTVRLKAPQGGFLIETAAPETQWFDQRGKNARDADEARWRWMVTPQKSGRRPLQLSITMRTIASDGLILETSLPEHQATVHVPPSYLPVMVAAAGWTFAALIGALLTLTFTHGWAATFSALGRWLG